MVFVLGYFKNPHEEKFDPPDSQVLDKQLVLPVIRRWLAPETVEGSLERLGEYWDGLLANLQVETPDLDTDRMVNVWNAYQNMITCCMSRSASFFESGIGRGMGFRDSNQDLLGFVHMVPSRARERIVDIAATQMADGSAYHQYQPLTKRGNNAIGSGFNDDPLWLILGVAAYLKETATARSSMRPCPTTTPRAARRRSMSTAPQPRLHARAARSSRSAADRASRLERLPQPQLLLADARRVVPDDREPRRWHGRISVHRGPVRARREGDGGDRGDLRSRPAGGVEATGRRPK